MTLDLSRIKTSTKAIVLFLLFNVTITQVEKVRDWVLPLIAHHPKLAGILPSLFGIFLALHSPAAQLMLHKVVDSPQEKKPDVPVEPGAQVDNVKVVTKPE